MTANSLPFSGAFRRLRSGFSRLSRDRRGNVLMLTGFSILPLTFATGMGVDYSRAMRLQTKLNAVADAASLAAVSQQMMGKTLPNACDAARRSFVTQSTGLDGLQLNTATLAGLTITITDGFATSSDATVTCPASGTAVSNPDIAPLRRTAVVTYRGTSSNAFAGILGIATLTVKGTSTSRTIKAPYTDIYVALDTSQSMGLAATDADAKRLFGYTKTYNNGVGCTFGCHVAVSGENYANEAIANYFGVKLRVDVLRDATVDMIQTAQTEQQAQQLYRFGLYRIGTTLTDISPVTTDLVKVKADAAAVTLGPNNAGGVGDTNLPDTTTSMFPKIVYKGNGTSATAARSFLFIITDGLKDVAGGGCKHGHCTGPIDPTSCDRYKEAGVTVGVVYTTFLPIKADPLSATNNALDFRYVDLVAPFASQIAPKLEQCASPGWYFEAADATTIHAAMQKLFAQASKQAAIIN